MISKRKATTPSRQALDNKLAVDLWTLSEKLYKEIKSLSS